MVMDCCGQVLSSSPFVAANHTAARGVRHDQCDSGFGDAAGLIDALQTGDHLHYNPETAKIELARFSGVYTKAVADVQALVNQTTVPEDELEKRVASQNTRETSTVPERAQRYKLYLKRARAQLENGMPK